MRGGGRGGGGASAGSCVDDGTVSESKRETIVGIDLGTTNSLVAVADERGPRVLVDGAGRALLPSVVRFELGEGGGDGGGVRAVVGHDARRESVDFPRTTISSVKRLMGRSLEDAKADLGYLSYEVVAGERGNARVAVMLQRADGSEVVRKFSPEEVSARVLGALKEQAEKALGREVRKAVVTVPAYFDDAQRQATRAAGRLAGLEVVRIVPEPTAAALAYGLGTDRAEDDHRLTNGTIAVYDLGGGTFDVSILRLTPAEEGADGQSGGPAFYQVIATSGDTHLGGDDFDHLLVSMFRREIAELMGLKEPGDLNLPPETRRALVQLAESVKIRLSEHETASVRIDAGGGVIYGREITRGEFDAMIAPLVERTLERCKAALRDAAGQLEGAAIDAVVMVGGSTRVPLVRKRVGEVFGIEPYTAIDPDQVVALGAAVQASILSGANRDALLLDVIPLSLGIETVGGAVAKLVVRNSTVPARATEHFSTSVDGQTSIRFTVFQGEREMAEDCRKLGEFFLRGLPPMPAGVPQINVEFLVDANGVLNVTAHERRSGKRSSLQVVPNHGLTNEEIERIEAESITHAKDDMTRHRVVDLITNSKLDLKWIGERLGRFEDRLEPGYRDELKAKIATLEEFVRRAIGDWRSVDPNAMYAAKNELDQASVRLQEVSIAASLRDDPPG